MSRLATRTSSPPGIASVSPASNSASSVSFTDPWHSRGYLPHFDQAHLVQSLTFRLHDALPAALLDSWRTELARSEKHPSTDSKELELRRRLARYEDAGHGTCWLRDERIAAVVENAMLFFDGQRYRLIGWCIMPNHVHGLIETWDDWPLATIIHSWKSYTAHEANRFLGRSGDFWFRDYHDRFIRDDEHFRKALEYIERNPVKARLARTPEEWRWSSAWWQKGEG